MAPYVPGGDIVETTTNRDQRLREIAETRGISKELDAEYIAWSLPKGQDISRGKERWIKVNLLGLCSPGSMLFTSAGYDRNSFDSRIARFTSTLETRCVRDIKRSWSWKIYGVSCDTTSSAQAHYVRVQFDSQNKDQAFEALSRLLDSLSVNRHVRLNVRPFGISGGVDSGTPNAADRLYMISNCAKQTPYLRKVSVDFEIYLDGEWRRLDHGVDRLGFATYKSTSRSRILQHDGHPDSIHFTDDAHLRFARMTLRFGERTERTMIDIENGERSTLHVSRAKKNSTIYLPSVRVRTSDGSSVSDPRHTMCRLIFREREKSGVLVRNNGKYAAAEATKVAALIGKTTQIASKNTLRIRDSVHDRDILELPIKALVFKGDYTVKRDKEKYRFKADLNNMFCDCTMYIVPCHRSSGIILIVQSIDGEYVIRQHIDNPVEFISAITENEIEGPKHSTLTTTRDRQRYSGLGRPHYVFQNDETDAALLVDRLVNLLTMIDNKHQTPSRLPLLTKILAQKKRSNNRTGHTRSNSSSSDVSNLSDLSNDSSLAESEPDTSAGYAYIRESADWEIFEAPTHELFEAPGEEIAAEAPGEEVAAEAPAEIEPQELPAQVLCRVKKDFEPEEPREVRVKASEVVVLEYKADPWSFVRAASGDEGWVPTSFLILVD